MLNDGLVLAVPACQYITTYLPTIVDRIRPSHETHLESVSVMYLRYVSRVTCAATRKPQIGIEGIVDK